MKYSNWLDKSFFMRILFLAFRLKEIFSIKISFPSKFNRIFQMFRKKNNQMNKHFQTHTWWKKPRHPTLRKKIFAAVRFNLAIFGSQIQCVIHSANVILFWKMIIFSSILRKYRGKFSPPEFVSPWSVF